MTTPAEPESVGTPPKLAPAPRPRPRRGYWIPGLIAMVALLAIGLALGAGDLDHRSPSVLHGADIAQEIALGIQAQRGTHAPPDVRCPQSEPVRNGFQFDCTTGIGDSRQTIHVVEIDGRGHLRWQLGS